MKFLTLLALLLLPYMAWADEHELTGDPKLACEAILCLSSGTRPGECGPSIAKSASTIAGAVKGGAGLATGFQAVKNEMMGEQADIASKMQEHRKEAGLPPESGFVKPPSATAVLGRMAQMGGAMMKQGIKNKASETVSNTAGGKLADMLKKTGE